MARARKPSQAQRRRWADEAWRLGVDPDCGVCGVEVMKPRRMGLDARKSPILAAFTMLTCQGEAGAPFEASSLLHWECFQRVRRAFKVQNRDTSHGWDFYPQRPQPQLNLGGDTRPREAALPTPEAH